MIALNPSFSKLRMSFSAATRSLFMYNWKMRCCPACLTDMISVIEQLELLEICGTRPSASCYSRSCDIPLAESLLYLPPVPGSFLHQDVQGAPGLLVIRRLVTKTACLKLCFPSKPSKLC